MSSVNVPHLTDTMVDALVAAARIDHPGGGEIILFSLTGAVADAKVRALPPPRHARCRAVRVAV